MSVENTTDQAQTLHQRLMRIAEIGHELETFDLDGNDVAALGRELLRLCQVCPQCLGKNALPDEETSWQVCHACAGSGQAAGETCSGEPQDDTESIRASLPAGHGHCQLDVLWKSGRSAADAVINLDQYAQLLSIIMPGVGGVAAGFHAAVAEPAQQEMSLLTRLATARHPYYCSDSSWYSRDHDESYASMTAFLDQYEDHDPDLFLCFRWDVRLRKEGNPSGGYRAEVFIIRQRQGLFVPCMVESITEGEAERFMRYARKHWLKLGELWNPVPGLGTQPSTSALLESSK